MAQFGICEEKLIAVPQGLVEPKYTQCGVVSPYLYPKIGWRCHKHRPLVKVDEPRREHNVGLNRKQRRAKSASKRSS